MTESVFELETDIAIERRSDRQTAPWSPPVALPTAPAADRLARFYMTSDLRAATGLTRTHLDYYLRAGLIVPTARTESGYLLFDDQELATLRTIIAQRRAGLGIREIRQRLGRQGPGVRSQGSGT